MKVHIASTFAKFVTEKLKVRRANELPCHVSINVHRFLPPILLIIYVPFRYLAGRFPETAHAIDLGGRTPLHYAATLADNGHYYNLLLHLGANPLVQDNVS